MAARLNRAVSSPSSDSSGTCSSQSSSPMPKAALFHSPSKRYGMVDSAQITSVPVGRAIGNRGVGGNTQHNSTERSRDTNSSARRKSVSKTANLRGSPKEASPEPFWKKPLPVMSNPECSSSHQDRYNQPGVNYSPEVDTDTSVSEEDGNTPGHSGTRLIPWHSTICSCLFIVRF